MLQTRKFYDDVLRLTSNSIDAAQKSDGPDAVDPFMYFTRGEAEDSLGWYAEAEADFQKSHDAFGVESQENLDRIQKIKAATPPLYKELKQGDQVLFRVYYDSESPIAQDIINSLPAAYAANLRILRLSYQKQSVYIFDTTAHARAFIAARGHSTDGGWSWAHGEVDGLYICLEKANGESLVDTLLQNPDYLRSTIAYELNHCFVDRSIGRAKLPSWFEEGLASLVGNNMMGNMSTSNNARLRNRVAVSQLVPAKVLLPLNAIEGSASFINYSQTRLDKLRQGEIAPNPYAQSESMVRFLINHMQRRSDIVGLLKNVRAAEGFTPGFTVAFSMTPENFFDYWARSLG